MLKQITESRATLTVLSFISAIILAFLSIIMAEGVGVMKQSIIKTYENETKIETIVHDVGENKIEIKKLCSKTDLLDDRTKHLK